MTQPHIPTTTSIRSSYSRLLNDATNPHQTLNNNKKKMNQRSRSSSKTHNNPVAETSTCTLPIFRISTLLLYLCHSLVTASSPPQNLTPPPLPILPHPNAFQLQWQLSNMAMFFHFGINTFTGAEWGSGDADPATFNPTKLNATQWITVAKECGFSRVILTAKHHDGFCLWPSHYTNYSVLSTKWRDGNGDVVGDLAAAAKDAGVGFGVYLSPWDRHDPSYGDTVRYNEYYLGQMTELLTR